MSHHIHSVIVSYNRVELTMQTIDSYLKTVSIPNTLVVVDNGSEDIVQDWLNADSARGYDVKLLGANRFPGYATNRGWDLMPPQTTLLHRSDNDFAFLPGWCEAVLAKFKDVHVGQVGLRTPAEELHATSNVGGNNVIRRELWDQGLRYDERPWGTEYPPGWTEDSLLSPAVVDLGYKWTRVGKPSIVSLSVEDPEDSYYQETWRLRGITPPKG